MSVVGAGAFRGNGRPHSPRTDGGIEGGPGSSWKGTSLTSPGHSSCQGSRDSGRWTDTSARWVSDVHRDGGRGDQGLRNAQSPSVWSAHNV